MKYLLQNKLWQFLVILFFCHQLMEKGLSIRLPLIDNYLDDLLCMPILLGGLLAEQMDVVKRQRLTWFEVVICIILVSCLFEIFLPKLSVSYTADAWDVCCYALGGLFYLVYLNPKPAIIFTLQRSKYD